MLKLILLSLILSGSIVCPAQNHPTRQQAKQFYDSLIDEAGQFSVSEKWIEGQLGGTFSILENDGKAKIDIESLQTLMDTTLVLEANVIKEVEQMQEIDSNLNCKQKLLQFLKGQNAFLIKNGPIFMHILRGPVNKRVGDIKKLATLSSFNDTSDGERDWEDAKMALRNVYHLNTNNQDDKEYVELQTLDYTILPDKTTEDVFILSFSAREECYNSLLYYAQFIVVEKTTGDTLRVLSPCQSYDINKGPRKAVLQEYYRDPADKQFKIGLVVFDKEMPAAEEKRYKTVVGSIGIYQ